MLPVVRVRVKGFISNESVTECEVLLYIIRVWVGFGLGLCCQYGPLSGLGLGWSLGAVIRNI